MGTVDLSGITLIILLALYILPGIVASCRDHKSAMGIWLLNVFLGWTLVGWVGALIWSVTGGEPPPPPPPTVAAKPTKPCPKCAETVLAAAVKCKHCGSDI